MAVNEKNTKHNRIKMESKNGISLMYDLINFPFPLLSFNQHIFLYFVKSEYKNFKNSKKNLFV